MEFKVGDEVELNCSVEEFIYKVIEGRAIYNECFKLTGLSTIGHINRQYGGIRLKQTGQYEPYLRRSELKYIKLKEVTMNTEQQIQAIKDDMNEAQDKLEALQKQLKQEQEPGRVFGFLPKVGSGEIYHVLDGSTTGATQGILKTSSCKDCITDGYISYKGLFWKTEKEANIFAEAMNTFLELRAQPEVVHGEFDVAQGIITFDGKPRAWHVSRYKSELAPSFATKADAQTVLDRFGSERLEQMFRVLGGFKD